jgi:hypothetical protein
MTGCYDCGLEYGSEDWLETIVPEKFWLEISPTGHDGGLLCFKCMRKKLFDLGYGKDKPAVPFKLYYHGLEGRSMYSELYPGLDDLTKIAAVKRMEWDWQGLEIPEWRKENLVLEMKEMR